jgi:hypothetical protein
VGPGLVGPASQPQCSCAFNYKGPRRVANVVNFSQFLDEAQKIICEAPILMLHKNSEVGNNFTFFNVELLKLQVFDGAFLKLS